MGFLKSFTFGVFLLSTVIFIITLLAPKKYEKQITMVLGIIFTLYFASKILNIDLNSISGSSFNGSFENNTISSEELVIAEIEKKISSYVEDMLISNGVNAKNVNVISELDRENYLNIKEISLEVTPSEREKAEALIKNKIGDIEVKYIFSEE